MCRNIKTLFNFEPPVTEQEIRAASLQFVRKISGFNQPSKANERLFSIAVDEIAAISGASCVRLKPARRPGTEKKWPQGPSSARYKDSVPEGPRKPAIKLIPFHLSTPRFHRPTCLIAHLGFRQCVHRPMELI
jgi:hypothetical protein